MDMLSMDTPLTREDLASLKAVKAHLTIQPQQQERLKKLGLIEQKLGGLGLTADGEFRLGMGK
jgi:hypothetical protein